MALDLILKEFPVTRYQGSKRKILPWIHSVLIEKKIEFDTALDAFGGTGMVSYLFKKMGKSVTYNDSLRFNFLIGRALIENSSYKINEVELNRILSHNSPNRFIQNTFKGIYFLDDENLWIDHLIEGIETTFSDSSAESDMKKAIAYYALFQACIIKRPFNLFHRKNLNLRTNVVERTFGNKTTWERPFSELFVKFITEANCSVFDNNKICKATNQSAFELDPYGYDLVYMDPPYYSQNGSHETANYLKCYHFLEGIANYESWEKLLDVNTPNLRFLNVNDNKDFQIKNIYGNFEELLIKYRKSKIVFSYKNGGLPSVDYIMKIMKKIKSNVYRTSIHYKYALNHQNGDASKNREVLIIGT